MRSLFAVMIVVSFTSAAHAGQLGAFIGQPVLESFEGLTGLPGVFEFSEAHLYDGDLTLPSGMVLRDPGPNQYDVLILDWTANSPVATIFGSESIGSAADVPDGAACLYGNDSDVTVAFPELAAQAGAYVTAEDATVTVSVYDSADTLLESRTVSSVGVAGWKQNFVGFFFTEPRIASLRVSGIHPAVDLVGYVSAPPPPATVDVEAPGANCEAGGVRIAVTGSSAVSYVCNGVAGPSGENGSDGATVLVATRAEPAGASCAAGGVRVDVGIDDDRDGTLGADEIDDTTYVCNGAAGAAGSAGADGADGAGGCAAFSATPLALLAGLLLARRPSCRSKRSASSHG